MGLTISKLRPAQHQRDLTSLCSDRWTQFKGVQYNVDVTNQDGLKLSGKSIQDDKQVRQLYIELFERIEMLAKEQYEYYDN